MFVSVFVSTQIEQTFLHLYFPHVVTTLVCTLGSAKPYDPYSLFSKRRNNKHQLSFQSQEGTNKAEVTEAPNKPFKYTVKMLRRRRRCQMTA